MTTRLQTLWFVRWQGLRVGSVWANDEADARVRAIERFGITTDSAFEVTRAYRSKTVRRTREVQHENT